MKGYLWKKNFLLLFVFSLLIIFAGCSNPASEDVQEKLTTEEIVRQALEKWYDLDSYDMDLTMNMSMTVDEQTMDLNMDGQATVFQNPMKMKMVMKTSIPGLTPEMEITQYMLEEEQKITLYQQLEGQWFKVVMDDPAMVQMMDPMDNLELFMDNLIQAEIVAEEKVGEIDTMKIDLIASGKIFDEIFKDMADQSLGLNDEILNNEVLSNIGDMKYTIWLEKDTLDTVKCQMDMTDNMKNLGAALAENPDTPEELKEIFSNMKMGMEYTVYNQNAAADFSIPEEAKGATELPASGL